MLLSAAEGVKEGCDVGDADGVVQWRLDVCLGSPSASVPRPREKNGSVLQKELKNVSLSQAKVLRCVFHTKTLHIKDVFSFNMCFYGLQCIWISIRGH